MQAHQLSLVGSQPGVDKRVAEQRKYDIGQLQAVHHEILRLKACGMKNVDIAAHLGITEVVVSYTCNSTLGREKLQLMSASRDADAVDFAAEIRRMLPKALKVYDNILSPSEDNPIPLSLQKATADTIVKDLAGKAAPKRIDARHLHAHMSTDEVNELKNRGIAAAAAAGMLVEG